MQTYRLLIVDDDESLMDSLVFYLESQGHGVSQANNGDEAIQQLLELRDQPFDLVILDIQMPKKDGLNFLISMSRHGFDLPVLVISGYRDKKTLLEINKLGFQDFLDKPFEPAELDSAIQDVLRNRG